MVPRATRSPRKRSAVLTSTVIVMSPQRATTITMSDTEFESACAQLVTQSEGFDPDALVGIATGGAFVAAVMRRSLGDNVVHVDIRLSRPSTAWKERLQIHRVLRRLPKVANDSLRRLEVAMRERSPALRKFDPRGVEAGLHLELTELQKIVGSKRVLIVDDTVDSGKTLLMAREVVRRVVPDAEIRTAVIASTWGDPPVRPDHCLHERTLVRFFWSLDAGDPA